MTLSPIPFDIWESVLHYLLVLYYWQEQDIKSWQKKEASRKLKGAL